MTALFDQLFDDAALFPPGNAPMGAAVAAHRTYRQRLDRYVGPFVVPAARVDELMTAGGAALPVSIIAPLDELGAVLEHGLAVNSVEVPPPTDAKEARAAVAALTELTSIGATGALEVPRTAARDSVLDVLAGSSCRAKLRTGGMRSESFPSSAELADTLAACVHRSVAFKCTAGMHHAIRHRDPKTGFEHHGFLNVLIATAALLDGAEAADAARLLNECDRLRMTAAARELDPAGAQRVRAAFVSFGTCSVSEPLIDLIGLELLEPALAAEVTAR